MSFLCDCFGFGKKKGTTDVKNNSPSKLVLASSRHSGFSQLSDDKSKPLLNDDPGSNESNPSIREASSYEPPSIPIIQIEDTPTIQKTSKSPRSSAQHVDFCRASQQQQQIYKFQKEFDKEVTSPSEINIADYQHENPTNDDSYEQLSSPSTSEKMDDVLPSPKNQKNQYNKDVPQIIVEHTGTPVEKCIKIEKEIVKKSFPDFQILSNSLITEGETTSQMYIPQPKNHFLSAAQLEVVSNIDYDEYSHEEFEEYYDDPSVGVLDTSNIEPQDDDDMNLSSRTVSPPEWDIDQSEDFDEDDFFLDEEEFTVIDNLDSSIFDIEEKNNLEIDYKRIRLIKELKKTELSYLKSLSTFQIYYINPLREMKQSIVGKDFLQKAISEMGVIYRVNKMFYDKLDQFVDIPETDEDSVLYEYCKNRASYNMEIELAKEISKFGQALKLYIGYITKYKSSIEQLNIEKKKNKKFERYLQEAFLNIAKDGLIPSPPSSYLIAPIQRIPRYQLLLSEIVKCSKHLPEVHPLLAKATEEVVSVAEYCNEKEREIQNLSKMEMLSKKLRNKTIIHPSRKFIAEAVFDYKKRGLSGTMTLYLFSDILVAVERGIVQKSKMIPFAPEKPISIEDHGRFKFLKQGENKIYTLVPKNGDKVQQTFLLEFASLLTSTATSSEIK